MRVDSPTADLFAKTLAQEQGYTAADIGVWIESGFPVSIFNGCWKQVYKLEPAVLGILVATGCGRKEAMDGQMPLYHIKRIGEESRLSLESQGMDILREVACLAILARMCEILAPSEVVQKISWSHS
ncbi:MAG: hypothetical protein Q7S03_00840 [bacterium]|nr:hypothetical protein [bacterium]